MARKLFTYEQALELLPIVQERTTAAVADLEAFMETLSDDEAPSEASVQYQKIVSGWAESMIALGIEVKGLWLIDFDSGSGYYCWRYPEPSLQYFHGYEEGFGGRVELN